MNANIKVIIQEKIIVNNSISTTLFPRLLAKVALIKKGNRKPKRTGNIINNSGIPTPNIICSFC
jgi:hypothetical protein